jgi:hypothetical protein
VLSAPAWLQMLRGMESVLTTKQIKELERLRKEYSIPHDLYSLGVAASSEFGKVIIRRDYKNFKKLHPNLSEKQILTALLQWEKQAMEKSGSTEVMTEEQITNAISRINSIDDLCDFVVELEHHEQRMYYENEICARIESIIKNVRDE